MGLAEPMHFELLNDAVGATARATLISAEALATQAGALVTNLSVGLLASSRGPRSPGRWLNAPRVTALAVAVPLLAAPRARSPPRQRARRGPAAASIHISTGPRPTGGRPGSGRAGGRRTRCGAGATRHPAPRRFRGAASPIASSMSGKGARPVRRSASSPSSSRIRSLQRSWKRSISPGSASAFAGVLAEAHNSRS